MSDANPLQLHCPTPGQLSSFSRFPSISTCFPSPRPSNSLLPPLPLPLPAPGMECENLHDNTIGVDDHFPIQDTAWNSSNMQFSAPSNDPPLALPWIDDLTLESQIHSLETEAYTTVLKAFHAQSDSLTWERESLISELRKELRVSDVEHRELLQKVKSENSAEMIRECHDNFARQQRVLSNMMNAPLKKQKIAHVPVSSSPHCLPCQPSTAATIFPLAKTTHVPASLSPCCLPCPPSTAATVFPLTGNLGPSPKPAALTRQPLSIVKDKSSVAVKMKKGLSNVGIGTSNKGGDFVRILATDKLIAEIETILRENPNPREVQKAKLVLGEHERSLRDALQKLGDVSIEYASLDHPCQHDLCQDVQLFGCGSLNQLFGHVDGGKGLLY